MTSLNLDDVNGHLPEIISGLGPGEQLVIVQAGEPLATLTRASRQQWPCKAGSYRKAEFWMAPDFDGLFAKTGLTDRDYVAARL